jgi:hypothetical protein
MRSCSLSIAIIASLTLGGRSLAVSSHALIFNSTAAKQFAFLSSAAYCDVAAWDCGPCKDVIGIHRVTAVTAELKKAPMYAFVASFDDGGVVVSYRGTPPLSLRDWLVDLEFNKQNVSYPGCKGCELHRGFYDSYLALSPGVLDALAAFGALTAPWVAVTGHSLGAAISEIATFELLAAAYPITAAYNFGDPRAGNGAWAAAYAAAIARHNVSSFRVTHFADPVPHLPPEGFGFRHPTTEVWYNEESSAFVVCSPTNGEDPACADSRDGLDILDHAKYLNVTMGGFNCK